MGVVGWTVVVVAPAGALGGWPTSVTFWVVAVEFLYRISPLFFLREVSDNASWWSSSLCSLKCSSKNRMGKILNTLLWETLATENTTARDEILRTHYYTGSFRKLATIRFQLCAVNLCVDVNTRKLRPRVLVDPGSQPKFCLRFLDLTTEQSEQRFSEVFQSSGLTSEANIVRSKQRYR